MAFNALVDGWVTSPDPGSPAADGNTPALAGTPTAVPHAHQVQGIPPLTGAHNTPLQVAFLGLVALAVVMLLRWAGFRFSFAGKVSGGGR